MSKLLRWSSVSFGAFLLVLSSVSTPILAAEPEVSPTPSASATPRPRGPQGPTGNDGNTGPTAPTGRQEIPQATPTPSPTALTVQSSPSPSSSPSSLQETSSPSTSTTAGNGTTGSNSVNTNSTNNSNTTTANLQNNADFNNTVQAGLSTGGNTASQNTQVGNVQTGEINGVLNIINVGNAVLDPSSSLSVQGLNAGNASVISLSPGENRSAFNDIQNSQTGENSINSNSLQNSNVLQVVRVDNAQANNNVVVNADTGSNILGQNTQVGNLQTGDINMAVNVLNFLNLINPNLALNVDIWSLLTTNPNAVIQVPVYNSTTGANSQNSNSVANTTNTGIELIRNGEANNNVTVNGNTGNNTVDSNTGTGNVSTGNTQVGGSTINIINPAIPTFYIVNVMGDWDGSLQGIPTNNYVINRLGNITTGANSINANTNSTTNTTDLSLTQNAVANNNLTVNANTGNNNVSQNTSAGDVSTGSINVVANLINILNSWGTDLSSFHLGVINIFGKAAPILPASPQTGVVEQEQSMPQTVTAMASFTEPITAVDVSRGTEGAVVRTTTSGDSGNTTTYAINAPTQVVDTNAKVESVQTTKKLAKAPEVSLAGSTATKQAQKTNFPWALALVGLGIALWLGTEVLSMIAKKKQNS